MSQDVQVGDKVAEGKTKIIWTAQDSTADLVVIESKDNMSAGNGRRKDVMAGKAPLANQTACNVFGYLRREGVLNLAFVRQIDDIRFLAVRCEMIPLEVVVRREAHGSYLKRKPGVEKGRRFDPLLDELFLKTSGQIWQGHELPCDDPLMQFPRGFGGPAELWLPDKPLAEQHKPFLVLDQYPMSHRPVSLSLIQARAVEVFRALERAWAKVGGKLVDFKVEFGADARGDILLADVIDNDSWRVLEDGQYIDKQPYRDGASLDDTLAKYRRAAEFTSQF